MRRAEAEFGAAFLLVIGAINWLVATRFGMWWLLLSAPTTLIVGAVAWICIFFNE